MGAQTTGPLAATNAVYAKADLMGVLARLDWRPGLCLVAGELSVGRTAALAVRLRAGQRYAFVASAATEVVDLDLYLRDPQDAVVKRDTAADGTPVLEYTPLMSGTHLLQLTLVSGAAPEADVALALLTERGIPLPRNAYRAVIDGFTTTTTAGRGEPARGRWTSSADHWRVYGFQLGPEEGSSLDLPQSAGAERVFAAVAAAPVKDIDLYLANAQSAIIASDETSSPRAVVSTVTAGPLRLRVQRGRGRLPAFVLLGVFEK